MVVVTATPPQLAPDVLELFHATDDLLSNAPILIFHGPSVTATSSTNTSRVQLHIFTPAGLVSFPRLTISPSSSLYEAVLNLPREEQGDEVCRALAFGLFKYFSELPSSARNAWNKQKAPAAKLPAAPKLFSAAHAARIASQMLKVENIAEISEDIMQALAQQSLSWVDLDVVLPPGSMKVLKDHPRESALLEELQDEYSTQRFGEYAPVVRLFGEPAFLPTSKLKRAPSKPNASNRTLRFTRQHKENLRREICELFDTEESYVNKMDELIHSTAAQFRRRAEQRGMDSKSPGKQALESLFPPSLDMILELNTGLYLDLKKVIEETEDEALADIQSSADDIFMIPVTREQAQKDVTGSLAVAKCLLDWFPKFADCYPDYIQAHAGFANFIKIWMKESQSSFSSRVNEHAGGEQRLMAMLIEPVQRLPRYNLYIDNMIKQLPVKHPAVRPLLKARDIIGEICSRDSTSLHQYYLTERLQTLIPSWPKDFKPQGRLISAMDVFELSPPYNPNAQGPDLASYVFLLFSDYMVMVQKIGESAMSSRGIIAEIDNPSVSEVQNSSFKFPGLGYHQAFRLSDISLTELHRNRVIQVASAQRGSLTNAAKSAAAGSNFTNSGLRTFYLVGSYEAKASKWVEEFVKARVEGRFSEAERESPTWEVRSVTGELSLFSAIFEEKTVDETPDECRAPAPFRIVIDPSKNSRVIKAGECGVEAAISLCPREDGFLRLEIDGLGDYGTRDHLRPGEFLPVLSKRLSNYLQMRNQIRNPAITGTLLIRNLHILKSLKFKLDGVEESSANDKSARSASPVKMLSSFFGGTGSSKETVTPRKALQRAPHSVLETHRMLPLPPRPATSLDVARPQSRDKSTVGFSENNALAKLEETFRTYILALHARKGNVVGKVLMSRGSADELLVNELYNSLLEYPSNHQAAAQSAIDILFCAFEKFLRVAWKDAMGPVIEQSKLDYIQSQSDKLFPADFEEEFRITFDEMAPQNQRALKEIVKLLTDLLDGTSNDSDRGILTASFAEMIVAEGNSHEYVSLLDRFVQEFDNLFSDNNQIAEAQNSMLADSRSQISNTGSLSSNASSLKKRFGFSTLARENSKSEHSSVGSVWRTLSKTNRNADGQPASLSKASLIRSKSTDVGSQTSPKRPISRERPTVLGAFSFEDPLGTQNKSFLGSELDTIGEFSASPGPKRKKRRSSLSDLKTVQTPEPSDSHWSPQTPHVRAEKQDSVSPQNLSPSKQSGIPTPNGRFGTPSRKENSPAPTPTGGHRHTQSLTRVPTIKRPDDITITGYSTPRRRGDTISSIPSLRPTANLSSALSDRPTAGNIPKIPPSPTKGSTSPTRKLRMQSPQKLRERLQIDQKAIQGASSALQAELDKISTELTGIGDSPARPTRSHSVIATGGSTSMQSDVLGLSLKVKELKEKQESIFADINAKQTAIANDVKSSLQVSESRFKKLEELYKQTSAENDLLYASFNNELEKIFQSVRAGKAHEEMARKLDEALEDAARLRKENARLKRENIGLKAQLRGE